MIQQENAIAAALHAFIDYAGLFPPAGVDMRSAVVNFLNYARGNHACLLGRLVVDSARINEFRSTAAGNLAQIPVSLLAASTAGPDQVAHLIDEGVRIEMLEVRADSSSQIESIMSVMPARCSVYFEVSIGPDGIRLLDAIAACGARAKLRMGGLVAEAFPSPDAVIGILQQFIERRILFKATAGLHHPLRSHHPYTYLPGSTSGLMHGFINLLSATAILEEGGDPDEAVRALNEVDATAWQINSDSIRWHARSFSMDQLRTVRETSFTSIGSCSFTEPIHDLESLGWL